MAIKAFGGSNKRPTSTSLCPPPHPPPNTQESNLPKRSKYERRNARSVPAPGKSRQAITVTITACRVKSKNVANVSYLPRFLASPNLSRRGPDPAGSGKHCKIVPVNEPACWVLDFGFWILGFGFWVLGFWVLDFGFWILGFRDLGFRF